MIHPARRREALQAEGLNLPQLLHLQALAEEVVPEEDNKEATREEGNQVEMPEEDKAEDTPSTTGPNPKLSGQ